MLVESKISGSYPLIPSYRRGTKQVRYKPLWLTTQQPSK